MHIFNLISGNVKRSSCNVSILCLFVLTLFFSQSAFSFQSTLVKSKFAVKCHVILIDGNEKISLWSITKSRLKKFNEELVGKKVHVSKEKGSMKVFKVHECVLEEDEFKGSHARQLDSRTPR